jgi:hypothetical protein
LIALLIVLPNFLWQVNHDFPLLLHLQTLKERQLAQIGPFDFGITQLHFPFTLVVSIVGTIGLISDAELKKYKSIGIAVLVTFVTMWVLRSKAYYIFAIYPVAFAAGAVKLERAMRSRPRLYYTVITILVVPALFIIPELTPVLPIDQYVKYYRKEEVNGRVELTGDYADMFGWDEQVRLVDSVYQSLSGTEKQNCQLWAENYGEAGALKILGKMYDLPHPVCRHGSFWLWGYGNADAKIWISLGNETNTVERVFEDVKLVKRIKHKYAISEENDIPLYICRNPKVDIPAWWRSYEGHIFE